MRYDATRAALLHPEGQATLFSPGRTGRSKARAPNVPGSRTFASKRTTATRPR